MNVYIHFCSLVDFKKAVGFCCCINQHSYHNLQIRVIVTGFVSAVEINLKLPAKCACDSNFAYSYLRII
jgi:hypothetical protein